MRRRKQAPTPPPPVLPTVLWRMDGGCNDCAAITALVDQGSGLFTLQIAHDDTCPNYKTMKENQE